MTCNVTSKVEYESRIHSDVKVRFLTEGEAMSQVCAPRRLVVDVDSRGRLADRGNKRAVVVMEE
jgi:hypothetical protein